MGKVRVAALGDETQEKKQKEKARLVREVKRAQKRKEIQAQFPLTKEGDGQDKKETKAEKVNEVEKIKEEKTARTKKSEKKAKFQKKNIRSAQYQARVKLIDKAKMYPLTQAIDLLLEMGHAKFDETVELHINTLAESLNGSITLPHGTGKTMKAAVASDSVIKDIEKGQINFDILLAEPQMMPKLARVAKILGPKGLMPNPKNGTISPNPEEAAKKFEGGFMYFKTEAKIPVMHLTVGKISFGREKLKDNITAMFTAIKKENMREVTLKSTMSPGIKVQV